MLRKELSIFPLHVSGSAHITDLPWTYLHMPLKIPTLRILSFEVEESESRPVCNEGIFFRQNKDEPFLPGTRHPPCMRLNGSPFQKKNHIHDWTDNMNMRPDEHWGKRDSIW